MPTSGCGYATSPWPNPPSGGGTRHAASPTRGHVAPSRVAINGLLGEPRGKVDVVDYDVEGDADVVDPARVRALAADGNLPQVAELTCYRRLDGLPPR